MGITALVLVGGALAAGLLGVALWQVNFIGMPYSTAMYARLAVLGGLAWRGPRRAETPTEFATALAGALALRRHHAETIAQGFARSRYAATEPGADDRIAIERAWQGVRRPLLRRISGRLNLLALIRREG